MLVVTLLIKRANEEYHLVHSWLDSFQAEIPHNVVEINISYDETLNQRIGDNTPAVQVGPYMLRWPFTEKELLVSLRAANERKNHLEKINDEGYKKRIKRGHSFSGADRFSLWFSKNYMILISLILMVYVSLPILAPVLMHYGIPGPAKVIYAIYKPLCHQLGFRSIFLYGEQPFYPRALAKMDGYLTYETITHQDEIDVLAARKFLGDQQIGYKTALCQRDLAMYGSLLLFALIFVISGRKIKGIPWYIWLCVGLLPIALDGFSQLPGLAKNFLPIWIPIRESVPSLRFITGFLFGFTTGWYLFPMLEETMTDTFQMMRRKMTIIEQLNESEEIQAYASSKQ